MTFNSLYEINVSLTSIIHQIIYLMYQINVDTLIGRLPSGTRVVHAWNALIGLG